MSKEYRIVTVQDGLGISKGAIFTSLEEVQEMVKMMKEVNLNSDYSYVIEERDVSNWSMLK